MESKVSWISGDSKDLTEYFKSQVAVSSTLSVEIDNWSKQKMDFVEKFGPLLLSGIKNIEKCFKWCETVWSHTKSSLENCVAKDEEISKHFQTKYQAEFLNEGKNKEKERDIHVGENQNMVENYMLQVLEILDQHKANHFKIMTDSTQQVRNTILKPLNTNFLDFQGTHYPKFKKISKEMESAGVKLYSSIYKQRSALTKMRSLMKENTILYASGKAPKKDSIKCLIRLFVYTTECFKYLSMQLENLIEAWKCYAKAMIDMNMIIHKNLIEFYGHTSKYAFPNIPGGTETNIFDQILFREDDVSSHLDSIFGPGEIEQVKKYSQKEGCDGVIEAVRSEKLNFLETFKKYLGVYWFDKKNSKAEQFLFINVTPDLFLNTFECKEFEGRQHPMDKAVISDRIDKIKTKAVEWKKEFILTGKQPGAWFSSGKSAFLMNDEVEVKELKEVIDKGKEKLINYEKALKPSK